MPGYTPDPNLVPPTVEKGAKNYVFHDTMTTGLEYQNNAAVSANPEVTTITNWYTIKSTPDTGDTITITFADGIPKDTVITITYSAKVTSDAHSVNPATNTASVTYGDDNSNNKTPDVPVNAYNAKLTVTKKDGKDQPLAGAGFVIKNSENKYYKLDNNVVTWVEDIADATEQTSGSYGAVPAFTGLGNGTYTLVEKTVPSGYNKAADEAFTIAGNDYTASNLEQTKTAINNQGSVLPSTGGIGTTIFYAIGAVLVIGAGIVLVTRCRMNVQ